MKDDLPNRPTLREHRLLLWSSDRHLREANSTLDNDRWNYGYRLQWDIFRILSLFDSRPFVNSLDTDTDTFDKDNRWIISLLFSSSSSLLQVID
jgi:hypothetical protein